MMTEASGPRSAYSGRGHSFSLYGPTISRQITYLFFPPTDKHIKGRTRSEAAQSVFHKKRFNKILENLWQSSETFRNLRKQFKSVFHRFYDFLKFFENLRKSSEAFGNLRKFSENFGNGSKVIFRCFNDF